MIAFDKPIYRYADGSLAATVNGLPTGMTRDSHPELYAEIESYLASLTEEERARVLVPEPVPPAPSMEERKAIARNARDAVLRDIIDRYNAPRWEAMTDPERQAVRDYRQALLDWPESAAFPDLSTMPVLGGTN